MTLEQLIEQCVARGLDWQLSCTTGMNGLPAVQALVHHKPTGAATLGMRTRSGNPVEAATEALKGALTDCVGKLEVANHGKR